MEQAQSSIPQPRRRAVAIADVVAALAAGLLLASMFLGWFRHDEASQLNGIGILFPSTNGNLIIVESGWMTSADVGAAALVMAGVALGQLLTTRFGFRGFGAYPGVVLASVGALVTGLILHTIDAPPDVYTRHQPGVYIALAAAIACIAAGLASGIVHGARLSNFNLRRLDLGGLIAALGAALLLVTMSLGWYAGRKYFSGSMPGYTPPDSLSPWASDDWVAYPLATVAVAAIVLWLARGYGFPRHPGLASIALALGGCVAAVLVLKRIDDPHSAARNLYLFNEPTTNIYLSLAGCLAIVAGACRSVLVLPREQLRSEWRAARAALGFAPAGPATQAGPGAVAADRRLPTPLVAGSLIALLIAALSLWMSPVIALAVIAGFAIGFAARRWWLLLAPWLITIPLAILWDQNNPCSPDADECLNILAFFYAVAAAVYVCVALAIGIVARRLSDREGPTSLRR
jgi:hypothetical protein